MFNNIRPVISFGVACVYCLATALFSLPATAGQNSWTAIGPDGISITALAIDPSTPSTAFAGTLGSGILKSTDGGTTWSSSNLGLPTSYITALAIDPLTPSTLYAGTGVGLFKSTDGGQGWSASGAVGAPAVNIIALTIDPASPTTLYAATSYGLFKTTDGAANWISIGAGLSGLSPTVIAIDPTTPSTLYVGVEDDGDCSQCGVFKSADAGMTWTRIYTTPAPDPFDYGTTVQAIVVDPSSPSRLYLALSNTIVLSTDGGANWFGVVWPGGYLGSLAIDPASPATLYAGTLFGEIFRTTDAGVHWLPATDGPLAASQIIVMALATSTPETIYAGGGTGVYRSSDNAQTWTRLTVGVRSIGLSRLTVDPSSPSTIYSTVGGVVMKTTDSGGHWAEIANGPELGTTNALAIDPVSPSTIYVGRGDNFDYIGGGPFGDGPVYKSLDGGMHWSDASRGLSTDLPSGIKALAIAPPLSSTLYAGDIARGVSKSVDGGSSWAKVNNGLTAVGTYIFISALAIDPTNADAVYVATTSNGDPTIDAMIFKSTNGGGQWRRVPISGPVGAVVTTLAVDPVTPSTLYAAYSYGDAGVGGIFKSIDSGETWTAAQNGLSNPWVLALAIDPSAPSRIYAATSNGVFRSIDAAVSWTPLNDGLGPNPNANAISIDRTGSILRAATNIGLFEYDILGPEFPGTVTVIEYFNAMFDDYFITANPDEINQLDSGAFFSSWTRTGLQFNAYATLDVPAVSVCRFFSTGFAPKSTHFYTPFASECAALGSDPNWELESASSFAMALPDTDGVCAAGLIPVYRLYNLSRTGVPNHRYTVSDAVRAQMISQGWVQEGFGVNAVEMCSPM